MVTPKEAVFCVLKLILVEQGVNKPPEALSFCRPHIASKGRKAEFSAWFCKADRWCLQLSFLSETRRICIFTKVVSRCNSWTKISSGSCTSFGAPVQAIVATLQVIVVLTAFRNTLHFCGGKVWLLIQFSWM